MPKPNLKLIFKKHPKTLNYHPEVLFSFNFRDFCCIDHCPSFIPFFYSCLTTIVAFASPEHNHDTVGLFVVLPSASLMDPTPER